MLLSVSWPVSPSAVQHVPRRTAHDRAAHSHAPPPTPTAGQPHQAAPRSATPRAPWRAHRDRPKREAVQHEPIFTSHPTVARSSRAEGAVNQGVPRVRCSHGPAAIVTVIPPGDDPRYGDPSPNHPPVHRHGARPFIPFRRPRSRQFVRRGSGDRGVAGGWRAEGGRVDIGPPVGRPCRPGGHGPGGAPVA